METEAQINEALRMSYRFDKGDPGQRDVVLSLGSMEFTGHCFADSWQSVDRDLGLAQDALSAHLALTKANDALAAALHRIAWGPIGSADASDRQILDDITAIAKAALATH